MHKYAVAFTTIRPTILQGQQASEIGELSSVRESSAEGSFSKKVEIAINGFEAVPSKLGSGPGPARGRRARGQRKGVAAAAARAAKSIDTSQFTRAYGNYGLNDNTEYVKEGWYLIKLLVWLF